MTMSEIESQSKEPIRELIDEIIGLWEERSERNIELLRIGESPRQAQEKKRERERELRKEAKEWDPKWESRAKAITVPVKWDKELRTDWMEAAETAGHMGMAQTMATMVERLGVAAPKERLWRWVSMAARVGGEERFEGYQRLTRWLMEQDPKLAREQAPEALSWAIFREWGGLVDELAPALEQDSPGWVSERWLADRGLSSEDWSVSMKKAKNLNQELWLDGGAVVEIARLFPEKLGEWASAGKIEEASLRPWVKKALREEPCWAIMEAGWISQEARAAEAPSKTQPSRL